MDTPNITVNGLEYTPVDKHDDKPLVITRARNSGVHVGRMVSRDGTEVELADARRIWSWQGANTLNELATGGAAPGSKISNPVASITILDACEIIHVGGGVEFKSGWPV